MSAAETLPPLLRVDESLARLCLFSFSPQLTVEQLMLLQLIHSEARGAFPSL